MSDLAALAHALELYAREELELQKETLEILERQEHALFHGDLDGMRAGQARVESQVAVSAARAGRRRELVQRLAVHFGVAASSLTLSSIAARLGAHGSAVAGLAEELRETAGAAVRRTRRLAALARLHARLSDDVLASVLGARGVAPGAADPGRQGTRTGALLDARV